MTIGGQVIEKDSLYTLRGINFDLLPNDLVLSYDSLHFQDTEQEYYWVIDSRSNDTITFRVQITASFASNHVWKYILSPVNPPRVLSEYVLL